MLEVINKNEVLVVDSRLIAEELGIEHKTLKETITKHKTKLESLATEDFLPGAEAASNWLYKENTPKQSDGTGGEVYYLLTEEQAIFLMTLSANTDKVVEAKFTLVKAFKKAKQVLATIESKIPSELIDLFKDMQQELKVLATRTKRLDELENASTIHKGCGNVIKAEADNEEYDLITAFEYLQSKGFGFEQANKLARRTATFERSGKGDNYEPPKNKKGHLLFEIKYLDQAFLSICNL